MNRRIVLLAGAAAILAMPYGASLGAANIPAYVATAVADTHRPKANTDQDVARQSVRDVGIRAGETGRQGCRILARWRIRNADARARS